MRKSFIRSNIIVMTLMLIFDIWYMFGGGLIAKSIASIMFVLAGAINFKYCLNNKTNLKFPKWMLIALICAMLGDILLVINFYLGVVVFAIGHIFYFISYYNLEKFNRNDLICSISIFTLALVIILFAPFLNFGGALMKGICCAYALIISIMVGKAISNLLKENNNTTYKIIAIGSILFIISDLMLMFDKFGSIPGTSYLCLATYYPAQFLLAFSLFDYAINHSKVNKYNS